MARLSVFGVLSNVQMLIHTLLKGTYVGTDATGNKYYKGKARKGTGGRITRERRWVIYKRATEASFVPPEWHGWLHHQTDVLPQDNGHHRKEWQKPHQPNMTGTDRAYLPPGHDRRGGDAPKMGTGYTAWKPE